MERSSLLGVVIVKLRTVPIGIFSVTIEQNSDLVHAFYNVFINYPPFGFIGNYSVTHKFVHGNDCVLARMICVVASWSVDDLVTIFHRVIVGNRDRLIMGYHITVLWSISWTPALDSNIKSAFCNVNA